MMRRSLIVVGVLLLGISGTIAWRLWPMQRVFYTDADTIKAPTRAAAIRQILWQPPKYRPDLTRAFAADHVPFVTADGLTLLFSRRYDGHPANIYYSRKAASGWSDPIALTAVNSDSDDLGPILSHDGHALFFYSDRAGSIGGYDLWVAYRHSQEAFEFDEAINLGTAVNSPFNDYAPAPTPDGDLLYFSSNRPPPEDEPRPGEQTGSATLHEDSFERTYDLYVSAVTGSGVGPARPLHTLNTPAHEGAPAVSPVGDFLYFASDRAGGRGGFDLYRSRRLEGAFEAAHNLGETVNSAFHDLDPSVGHGGFDLYFSSDRSVGKTTAESDSPREYKLFQTVSREVFVDYEAIQRAPIRWAAIWSAIWPNLLWMLIAFTLALLLFTLMRRSGERRLSLLMRCLLGSMLAHLVLVMLLTVWGVTASIAGEYSRRGKIQIALASPTTGREVAAQITGGLTTLEAPMIEAPSFDRAETPKESPVEAGEARLEVSHQPVPVEPSPDVEMTLADASATWRSESREWRKPQALQPTLAEVWVSTPTESMRVSRQESAREVSPSETPVRGVERPDVVVTTAPQPTQSVAVEVARLDQLPVMRQGLIERVVAGEALVPTARVIDTRTIPRPTDLPPAPGVPLAMATEEKIPDAVEIQLDPSQRTRAVPQLRISDYVGIESSPDEFASMPPEATEPAAGGGSLAAPQLARASDVVLVPATVPRPSVIVDITPPDGKAAEVSTPHESVKMARATEGVDRMEPAVRPEVIRAESLSLTFDPPTQLFDRMDPDRATPVVGEASMVSVLCGVELDQSIPLVPLAKPTAAPTASVWPEQKTIELPQVAESRVAQASEQKKPVERVEMADLRADVDSWLSQSVREVRKPNVDVEVARETVAVVPDSSFFPTPTVPDDLAPVMPVSYVAIPPVDIPEEPGQMALELELSPEESPPENAFLQRSAPNKMEIVKRMGGSEETEAAVALALKWLAQHQDTDGFWNIRVFDERCGGCDHTQAIPADVALTGLATLSFLGAGHTQDSGGPYEATVSRAIDWLLEQQAANGDLRGEETTYSQGIATMALAEALAMTDDERLREPVELALRFIYAARNRHEGGWQYDLAQASDTSVLGWMMMAMKSASTAGLPVPRDAFDVGTDWLERVSDPDRPGLYPYRPDQQASPSMTAEAMFVQQLLGKTAADPIMQESADYILEHLPDWDRDPDTYFWYYASLALFQHQGPAWTTWNDTLKRELVAHQRKDDQAAGSWDPQGNQWSELGGRVYQTALCTLMLEVYYRYLPMYSNDDPTIPDRPEDAFGTIAGVVRDADTGRPLVGATVRLDVPDGEPILAQTDRDGFYYLWTPRLPPFFALSAAQEGYVPESLNVDSTTLRQNVLDVDFDLRSDRGEVFSTEAVPEVHHLGDNRFDGTINSQFQKQTEGAEYGSEFVITSEQLARRFRRAELRLMAKGVQRRHSLFINGILLDDRLDHAPRDGSFGDFRASFDPKILRAGTNTIDLIARPSNSDIDDFEFVNVQIHLFP